MEVCVSALLIDYAAQNIDLEVSISIVLKLINHKIQYELLSLHGSRVFSLSFIYDLINYRLNKARRPQYVNL